MRILIPTLIALSLTELAYADALGWRVEVTCDAEAREARVELYRCDGNVTESDNPAGCLKQKTKVSDDIRKVTVDAKATRLLHTPVRSERSHVGLLSNHPAEFSCHMPSGEPSKTSQVTEKNDDIFLRLERYPTTFNWGGQCGASAYSASLSIQTGTANLDFTKPMEKIEMVGRCGWGDPGPISTVTINADTGEISKTPYATD